MSRSEINALMGRAIDSLEDARFLYEANRFNGVPNRSYYAIFDAVNALLRLHEQHTKTHKGAKAKFNALYIKTNQMPEAANLWLEEYAQLRQSGDYDFSQEITKEQAAQSIEYAKDFLLHTEAYLRDQNRTADAADRPDY